MTINEMRQELDKFCDKHQCGFSCPLGYAGHKCGSGFTFSCEPGECGYMTDDEIRTAYETAFRGTGEVPGTDPTPAADEPHIRDSGFRTEFSTGAVRDMVGKEKGRCDLLPLDVVAEMIPPHGQQHQVIKCIADFVGTGDDTALHDAIYWFYNIRQWDLPTMLLEVSKHFAEGAEKYSENNWRKGIPLKSYINSGVRHYLKWLRGDKDEPHDRAFCWNVICAIWTCKHKPELNDYGMKTCPVCNSVFLKSEGACPHCRVHIGESENNCIICGKSIPAKWQYCDTCWENEHGGN